MMASFADLIDEIDRRYSPGPKAPQLVQETYHWVMEQPGGAEGLLERCGAAGLAAEVASWSDGLAPVPLSGQEVEQTLGSETLGAFAEKTGLNPNFVRTILGYALPEIIMLAKSGAVPPEIPASDADATRCSAFAVPRRNLFAGGHSAHASGRKDIPSRSRTKGAAAFQKIRRFRFGAGACSFWFGLGGMAFFRGSRIAGERRADRDAHGRGHNGPQSQRRGFARRAEPVADRRHHACGSEVAARCCKKRNGGVDRRRCGEGRAATGSGDESLATFRAAGSPRTSDRGPRCRGTRAPPRCKAPRAPGSRRKWPPRCQGRQPSTPPKIPAAQDRAETGRN